jgi:3-oxoacyl-[acyl-carrier protein] reductase
VVSLAGQVVIITGAARGIGRATALLLGRAGASLVLNYEQADDDAASLERELGELGHHGEISPGEDIGRRGAPVRVVKGDVARPATATALAETALATFGRIDVLVNNAAISTYQPLLDHPDDVWERTISVNLSAAFYSARAVMPTMLRQHSGRIINLASQMGLIGAPGYAAYCASKGGLITLTKALAQELGPEGILVNCVAPGPVETDMLKVGSPEYNEQIRLTLPVRRWGRPEEIAETIAFLCGPGGDYYCGWVLSPNGGSVM